ncbi:MAG: leucine-rich repeat domain-containing protein [Mycoplasma sp.]
MTFFKKMTISISSLVLLVGTGTAGYFISDAIVNKKQNNDLNNDAVIHTFEEFFEINDETGELLGLNEIKNTPEFKQYIEKGDNAIFQIPEKVDGVPVKAISENTFKGVPLVGTVIIKGNVDTIAPRAFANKKDINFIKVDSRKYEDTTSKTGDKWWTGYSRNGWDKINYADDSSMFQFKDNASTGRWITGFTPGNEQLSDLIIPNTINGIEVSGILSEAPTPGESFVIGAFSKEKYTLTGSLTVDAKKIDQIAFFGQTELNGTLTIGSNVEEIGSSAFSGCSNLTKLDIQSSKLVKIENSAFSSCSKISGDVIIPDSVNTLGRSIFSNCTSINSISLKTEYKVSWFEGFTTSQWDDKIIYRDGSKNPSESLEFTTTGDATTGLTITGYQVHEYEKHGIIIPDQINGIDVVAIGDNAFQDGVGKPQITGKIVIGNNVETIGKSAFQSQWASTEITIGKKVKTIGDSAFKGCGFKKLTIPSSVETLGSNLILSSGSLTELNFEENSSLKTIGSSAFARCDNLSGNITIPESVELIGSSAFSDCTKIDSLIINSKNTLEIKNAAFKGCINLGSKNVDKTIMIPDITTSIGESAFSGVGLDGEITIKVDFELYKNKEQWNQGCTALILNRN